MESNSAKYPIVEIRCNGKLENTSLFLDGIPVQNAANIYFSVSERFCIISYTTVIKDGDSDIYKVTEYSVQPTLDEISSGESRYKTIETDFKFVTKDELNKYSPSYILPI